MVDDNELLNTSSVEEDRKSKTSTRKKALKSVKNDDVAVESSERKKIGFSSMEKSNLNLGLNNGTVTNDNEKESGKIGSFDLGLRNLNLNSNNANSSNNLNEGGELKNGENGASGFENNNLQNIANTANANVANITSDEVNAKNEDERNNFFQRRNRMMQDRQLQQEYVINTEQVTYVKDLRDKNLDELIEIAEKYEVQNLNRMLKQDIISAILKQSAIKGEGLYVDGCLEVINEGGFGFLRDSSNNYRPSSYDAYISQNQIRKLGLRQGDVVGAYIKEPRKQERYFSVVRIETINGKKVDEMKNKVNFDNLIPLYPTEKLKFDKLSNPKEAVSTRVIDLMCPIGKGQRALIVAPPRAGKTFLMQAIAHAINENHPEVELIVLLIDERPEEVTDMVRSVKGEVVSSTFDEPAKRHVELAEIVIEKARRMVEDGKDVIILLDSITRLARAYNAIAPSSGKVLTGGVDSNALQKPKRFFGAARNIENGGSLTIIATALVETGSKMDEVIFEEFKGTGNSEIVLDRKIAEKRLFPAIDILKSGTRREEEMVEKEELQKTWILRRILINMAGNGANNTAEALEFLLEKLKKTKDNKDFFEVMNSGVVKV